MFGVIKWIISFMCLTTALQVVCQSQKVVGMVNASGQLEKNLRSYGR